MEQISIIPIFYGSIKKSLDETFYRNSFMNSVLPH